MGGMQIRYNTILVGGHSPRTRDFHSAPPHTSVVIRKLVRIDHRASRRRVKIVAINQDPGWRMPSGRPLKPK